MVGLDVVCLLSVCVFSINLNIKVRLMRGLLCRKPGERKLWPFLYMLFLFFFDGKM